MDDAHTQLPALRYECFVTKLQQEVEAARERILAMSAMENVYKVVVDALERCKHPNDTDVHVSASSVSVGMVALPTDRLADFKSLVGVIGYGLQMAGLHDDGVPSIAAHAHSEPLRVYRWQLAGAGWRQVALSIEVPKKGLPDCRVVRNLRTYTSEEYHLVVDEEVRVAEEVLF